MAGDPSSCQNLEGQVKFSVRRIDKTRANIPVVTGFARNLTADSIMEVNFDKILSVDIGCRKQPITPSIALVAVWHNPQNSPEMGVVVTFKVGCQGPHSDDFDRYTKLKFEDY